MQYAGLIFLAIGLGVSIKGNLLVGLAVAAELLLFWVIIYFLNEHKTTKGSNKI